MVFTILRRIDRIIMYVRRKSGSHRSLLEARSVGRRLTSELSKIKVRASFVTQIHGFSEPALGVEAVKDDGVNADGENFDNNLNKSAKQRPVLKTRVSTTRVLISQRPALPEVCISKHNQRPVETDPYACHLCRTNPTYPCHSRASCFHSVLQHRLPT